MAEKSAGTRGRQKVSEIVRTVSLLRELVRVLDDEITYGLNINTRENLRDRCIAAANLLEHGMAQAEAALEMQRNLTTFYAGDPIHRAYENGMVVIMRILDNSRSAPQQRPPYGFY